MEDLDHEFEQELLRERQELENLSEEEKDPRIRAIMTAMLMKKWRMIVPSEEEQRATRERQRIEAEHEIRTNPNAASNILRRMVSGEEPCTEEEKAMAKQDLDRYTPGMWGDGWEQRDPRPAIREEIAAQKHFEESKKEWARITAPKSKAETEREQRVITASLERWMQARDQMETDES